MTNTTGAGNFDIGAVLKSPFEDPDWLKKSIITGLLMLIPIVGGFNSLGWARAVYLRQKNGEPGLPEANLNYIGDGAVMFFAVFLAVLPVLVVVAILGGIASALGIDFLGALLGLVVQIAYAVFMPAVLFVAARDRDVGAGFRFAELRRVITGKGVGTYALFVVTLFLASLFADVGVVLLCVGIFVTAPLAAAFVGAAVHELERA